MKDCTMYNNKVRERGDVEKNNNKEDPPPPPPPPLSFCFVSVCYDILFFYLCIYTYLCICFIVLLYVYLTIEYISYDTPVSLHRNDPSSKQCQPGTNHKEASKGGESSFRSIF
jgi:hypothetical protein